MIIHMWMHWFWITTASFKCFFYLTVQMISSSCISHSSMATGAGLLDNDTFIHENLTLYKSNDSSQVGHEPNITSPGDDEENFPLETVPQLSLTTSSAVDTTTIDPSNESARNPDELRVAGTSDSEDTYNPGNLDVFQYPIKKVTKYSQIKYGKMKLKSATSEEANAEDDKNLETLKIIEEKLHINISIGERGTTERPNIVISSDPTESTRTGTPFDNTVTDSNSGTDWANETAYTEEPLEKKGYRKPENVTVLSTVEDASSAANTTEDADDNETLRNETLVIENKVEESVILTTMEPFLLKNRVAAATSAQNFEVHPSGMNAGSVTGITLGILVVFGLFGAISFVLYRRRYLNKPQVLHDKCSNLDSSGYIDDTSLRDNSEEMYSLDNDSFLNSLEAMTIQNYWTETVKHTKL